MFGTRGTAGRPPFLGCDKPARLTVGDDREMTALLPDSRPFSRQPTMAAADPPKAASAVHRPVPNPGQWAATRQPAQAL